ncbi:MAG: helix-turn-helix domain-containing protein [Deltaproteobacteria bacterium]|nr:helix-turn-helix domain-containing protein [Deltaproteobacteria bacterium]MBW1915344.1 helix-turn-helix domain-containing protein [Deltaproteobacteria bacterium]
MSNLRIFKKQVLFTYKKIASEIQVHKSTISREIKRIRSKKDYRPKQAA